MKNISPGKVFVIILISGLLFVALLLVPQNGFKIILPKLSDFIPQKIEEIPINTDRVTYLKNVSENDSVIVRKAAAEIKLLENEKILHSNDFDNEMASFYKKIINLQGKDTLVRVLHFGDSQIEGDRVTGVIRNALQKEYGGCGVGFLPVSENRVHRLNVKKTVDGWKKYKVFGMKQKANHDRYGFTGYVHEVSPENTSASIEVRSNKKYYKTSQRWNKLSILYQSKGKEVPFKVTNINSTVVASNFSNSAYGLVQRNTYWNKDTAVSAQIIEVEKADSVEVYGISLDCMHGIAVDNVAMRGSSGLEFSKLDRRNFQNQIKHLNVGLIIYHFGVNVIPGVLDDYRFYENLVYKQLKILREVAPGASILVIGVSDMAKKEGKGYVSYPNIAKVKKAQRRAAKRAGCAFWDLQQVMGGEDSMVNWVSSDPPLAEKDYTHFNGRGARVIGNKLFEAIQLDFKEFKNFQIN